LFDFGVRRLMSYSWSPLDLGAVVLVPVLLTWGRRIHWPAGFCVGLLLALSGVLSWLGVAADTEEPGRLVRATAGWGSAPFSSFYQASNWLDSHLEPGERVAIDGSRLFPVIATLGNQDALLLPFQPDYPLAVQ